MTQFSSKIDGRFVEIGYIPLIMIAIANSNKLTLLNSSKWVEPNTYPFSRHRSLFLEENSVNHWNNGKVREFVPLTSFLSWKKHIKHRKKFYTSILTQTLVNDTIRFDFYWLLWETLINYYNIFYWYKQTNQKKEERNVYNKLIFKL